MHRTSPEVAVALGKSIQAYDEKQRRLAAAAPEMLAALKMVSERLRDGAPVNCGGWVNAAIAKAEGR